jgi:hypothetical protein
MKKPSPLRWARSRAFLLGFLCLVGLPGSAAPAHAQVTGSIVGRVLDLDSGEGVADATVVLEGSGLSALCDAQGLFRISAVPPGEYALRVVHVAYGELSETVRVEEGEELALRIHASQTAIELEPVVVQALSGEELEVRSRGTRRNVVTREEIARSQGSGAHLGQVLARHVPGIRVKTVQRSVGQPICIEFRSPVSLHQPLACKHPVVFLDGVRVSAPQFLFSTLPLEDIQRMEVIPPGEAGVAYGTDSRYGVLLIETRTAANVLGEVGRELPLMTRARYDWTLEPDPYQWKRVLGLSFLGGLAGLALGYAAAGPCLRFEDLSSHFYEPKCSGLPTAASRVAFMTLPQVGASLAARYAGSTERSRGRLAPALLATSLIAVPGLVLALTTTEDGFGGSDFLGKAFVVVGVPASATLADWMFRRVRNVEGTLR